MPTGPQLTAPIAGSKATAITAARTNGHARSHGSRRGVYDINPDGLKKAFIALVIGPSAPSWSSYTCAERA